MINKIKSAWPYWLLFLLVIITIWPLLKSGFFVSDDGEWMVVRLSDFHRSLVSGMFPVRWAARLNHQFGYPVFNFLYPLSLYWGEFFHLIGFNFVDSIKLVFAGSFFLSAFFMYLFAKSVWQESQAAFLSAVFYIFAPYRFFDVYVRGSIGEAVSFIFVPLIFFTLQSLAKKKNYWLLSLGAIGIAGLIMSHNIMAMLFFPLVCFYALYFLKSNHQLSLNSRLFKNYLSVFVLGLGLSAFFWLPALYDTRFIILNQVEVANFADHFPSLKQLFWPSPFHLGFLHLAAVLAALVLFLKNKNTTLAVFLLFFFSFLFLMLPVSLSLWQLLPLIKQTQFPWRLLAITVFASSILIGGVVSEIKQSRVKLLLTVLLTFLVVAVNFSSIKPQQPVNRTEGFYATNEATTTVKDEYLPIWVKQKPIERPVEKVIILSGQGKLDNLFYNSKKVAFNADIDSQSLIQVNIVYFPGWQLVVNGVKQEILPDNEQGTINFYLPAGEHRVNLEFKETTFRLIADYISLASGVIILVLIGFWFKKRK